MIKHKLFTLYNMLLSMAHYLKIVYFVRKFNAKIFKNKNKTTLIKILLLKVSKNLNEVS